MKGGGRPYRSVLLPHYALIANLRSKYATWSEVAAALGELGVQVTPSGVQHFVARRLNGRRLPYLLGGQAEPAAEPRPAVPVKTAAPSEPNKFDDPTFVLETEPSRPNPEPPQLFDFHNDIRQ